ncbi:MAG: hypothetical protein HFE39_08000 [Clostridiales bacterium]|jgi:hypothetical protein|nr:hypothetical protein [Clostridiales bacterium]
MGKDIFTAPYDWQHPPCTLTPEEENLIQLFRRLSKEEQQQMLDCLRDQNR